MTGFVVVVSLQVHPESLAPFRALVVANAETSKAREPGCRRFDVAIARGDPNAFLLYEIYDSRDAFRAHLATEHFLSFDKLTAPMVQSKKVLELDLCIDAATDTQAPETPAADTEVRP
jgi:quinol monooxygenase YgiN